MFNAKNLLNQLVQTAQGGVSSLSGSTASLQQKAGGLLNNPALTGALGMGGGLLTGMMLGNSKKTEYAPVKIRGFYK